MSNELQTVDSTAPVRTADVVALEIRTLQRQAQGIILSYAIEIGRRLEEVKAMLPHGEWGPWLKRELDYSQSTAQNFMRVFREYGDNQISFFGAAPKSQTFGNLTYSKALRLLAIPDEEERARFVEEHDVGSMTTRELTEALKARDAAEEEAAAAQDEIRKLKGEATRLGEEFADKTRVYEAKLTAAGVEADLARANAQSAENRANEYMMKLKAAKLQSQTTADMLDKKTAELSELEAQFEELRSHSTEPDTGAIEAARKAAIEEMTGKLNKAKEAKAKAEEKRKAAEEALAAVKKELSELKTKEPEVRELTPEEKAALTAEAVDKVRSETAAKIRSMEKQLAAADPSVSELRVVFKSWQEDFRKIVSLLDEIARSDETRADKLREGVKAALAQMEV